MDFTEKIKEEYITKYGYKKVIFIVYIVFAFIIILIIYYYYINEGNGINIDKSNTIYLHPGLDTRKNKYGLGVHTTQDIPANTIVLKEKLYFLNKRPVDNCTKHKIEIIKKMLNEENSKSYLLNLTPYKLDNTMNIYNYNDDVKDLHMKYLPELDPNTMLLYLYKITRNSFNYNYYSDYSVGAFCFYGTKLNHSCEPNVDYHLNKQDDTIIFKTTKDIKADGELFISYIDVNHCKCSRQNNLKEDYGFDCECEKCKTTDYCREEKHL